MYARRSGGHCRDSSVSGPRPVGMKIALFMLLSAPVLVAADQGQDPPPQPGQVAPHDQNPPDTNLPNTVSAPPFTVADKFDYRVVQSFGLRGLAGSLFGAAIGQARDAPHEWGQGVEGFATRYG